MIVYGKNSADALRIGNMEVMLRDVCGEAFEHIRSRIPANHMGTSLREWGKLGLVEIRPDTFRNWGTLAYQPANGQDKVVTLELYLQEEAIALPWYRLVEAAIYYDDAGDHCRPLRIHVKSKILGEHVIHFSCVHPKSYDIDRMRLSSAFPTSELTGAAQ